METILRTLAEHGYTLGEPIGSGAYSTCYMAYSNKYKQSFVCKIMNLEGDGKFKREKIGRAFKDEVYCLIHLIHPNVIKVYDYFSTPDSFILILEHCSRGSLDSLIKNDGVFQSAELLPFCKQFLSALKYCHDNSLAHHDIKPSNIFIDEFGRYKLADFGLAQIVSQGEKSSSFTGSLGFMAPEIFDKREYDPYKADVWSFGVTLYQLTTGNLPFVSDRFTELKKMINSGQYEEPECAPEYIQLMLKHTIVVDPEARWTVNELWNYINSVTECLTCKSKRLRRKQSHVRSSSHPLFTLTGSGILSSMNSLSKLPPMRKSKVLRDSFL